MEKYAFSLRKLLYVNITCNTVKRFRLTTNSVITIRVCHHYTNILFEDETMQMCVFATLKGKGMTICDHNMD